MDGTRENSRNIFCRFEANPILVSNEWPYTASAVFNPGAVRFKDEVFLLVRVEDRRGYSHLTLARSEDGKTAWRVDSTPTLIPDRDEGEEIFGLEDPRIVWVEDLQKYVIAYVSFFAGVSGEPTVISLLTTTDFSSFQRLGRQFLPQNKDASLFPRKINGEFALVNRPVIEGRGDIWVSFSPNLQHWGHHRVLLPTRHRSWDADRVGLGPPPIETSEGWLIIYHGTRRTTGGDIYRAGIALLDLETLEVIHRSEEWVLSPQEDYEMTGDVHNIVFPSGAVINEENELLLYYGAADSVVCLAVAYLGQLLDYLKNCPEQ